LLTNMVVAYYAAENKGAGWMDDGAEAELRISGRCTENTLLECWTGWFGVGLDPRSSTHKWQT